MTELNFKGKEFVYNHHLAVPFRPLVPEESKGIGPVALDGNLIVHGDNLHALKALLPLYAGKVDCIFIDPPYNTGNEGWCYNDNVNAPMIREWLDANPVGEDDGLRHDKWCAMMWPRLRLLYELLDDHGVMFVSIGDDEAHRLTSMCCELFGSRNHVATFVWRKVDSPNDNKVEITPDHEYVLCFARDIDSARFSRMAAPGILKAYTRRDSNGRMYRDRLLKKNGRNSLRRDRPTMWFPLEDPDGSSVFPIHDNGEEACWSMGLKGVERHESAGTLIWKRVTKLGREVWEPYTREYAPQDNPTRPYPTIWSDVDTMRQAKAMLRRIFVTADLFNTPKTVSLVRRIIEMCTGPEAIILDSFAGSGTTAHAVLESNIREGANRRFILVEMEDYADRLTAERVRRVINGYAFRGTQRTELLREKLTWTKLKQGQKLRESVDGIENLHGHEYDAIKKTVKDGELIVTGEKAVEERAEGLGGSFTYCTLGDPVELDRVLRGETLPTYDAIGSVLFHMATARALDPNVMRESEFHLGATEGQHVWLIYRPDLDWLKSPEAALTLKRAKEFAETDPEARHLVFAPARYVSQKMLAEQNIPVEFVPLPFALYRIDRS
ncbi:MAG: site-specific DNA-methyltransferase [Boseongicola sp. SB0677_bin_26]|nr:site-specific DNA-methyltransferase [Boseongicola sp. SB0665_bin_10]MYG26768.1 site-specific DNA-methyltransferase [Boseongicola sp. SB0677_bin_26]